MEIVFFHEMECMNRVFKHHFNSVDPIFWQVAYSFFEKKNCNSVLFFQTDRCKMKFIVTFFFQQRISRTIIILSYKQFNEVHVSHVLHKDLNATPDIDKKKIYQSQKFKK